ncbi:MAG: bacillithiol system redox-active protein YtxJ [Cyclobacteriaceae bacterium]
MNFTPLTTIEQVDEIKGNSNQRPVIIYKHSTRCGISSVVLSRLERSWQPAEMQAADFYFLDLISFRQVSQSVADTFGIRHESPQVLLISEGKCVYDASHMMISYSSLRDKLQVLSNSSAS